MRYTAAIAWGNVRPQTNGAQTREKVPSFSTITGWGGWWCGMRSSREDHFWGRGALTPQCFPKIPFRFRRTSQLPSEKSVSSEHWQDYSSTPKDRRHYCIQVRVKLGNEGGHQPPPSHVWGGCLITNIFPEAWPEEQITKAIVLSLGEALLFFGRNSKNEGLSYCRATNVEFGLGGPFNWAGR